MGVALTLALWGALVAGTLLVQDLKADWMSSMRVELVLAEPPVDGVAADQWVQLMQSDEAVTEAVYVDPDSAARELESELGEPFMDFLGASPLPAVLELTLSSDWMGEQGLNGLTQRETEWLEIAGCDSGRIPQSLVGSVGSGLSRVVLSWFFVGGGVDGHRGGTDHERGQVECVWTPVLDSQYGACGSATAPNPTPIHC